jgi:hypothetical protein
MIAISDDLYEELVAYTQNRCTPEETSRLEAVLERDAAARQTVAMLRDASSMLTEYAALADPLDEALSSREDAVMAAVYRQRRRRLIGFAAAGVGIAAVLAIGLVFERPVIVGEARSIATFGGSDFQWRDIRAGEELEATASGMVVRLKNGAELTIEKGGSAAVRVDGFVLRRGNARGRSGSVPITIAFGTCMLRLPPDTEANIILDESGRPGFWRLRVSNDAALTCPPGQERIVRAGETVESDACAGGTGRSP